MLGFPIAPNKLEGPEIDSLKMEIRLPQDKLRETELLVSEWLG